VQDYDPIVQKVINRIQPFDAVRRVHEWSQDIGYTSISHDLVFGLPKQTKESIINTIEKTNLLRPDRISFYSYAHVPWIKGVGQRGFDESDLPKDEEKRLLYETGKEMFARAGYHEIGMDHFALPNDSLYTAMTNKTLHRNFMGYTTNTTQLMIGLGMSSISDSWYAFAQNEKSVEDYEERVGRGELPVFRGHLLNAEDLEIRRHILNLMCHFETAWSEDSVVDQLMIAVSGRLIEMENDGLIIRQDRTIKVTENGKPFVRNLCMAFDARLLRDAPTTRLFSMTV
jgi:oxygen-independent coproporphyrinogen-3 oxidase